MSQSLDGVGCEHMGLKALPIGSAPSARGRSFVRPWDFGTGNAPIVRMVGPRCVGFERFNTE